MPAKTVLLRKNANKNVQRLPKHIRDRIPEALFSIRKNPLIGFKLHGDLDGYYKYRIGDYRIIYLFDAASSTVEILIIEHRQGVYK